jgi:hypothetical protein
MSLTFSDLVEEIRHRPIEEKVGLKEVLDHDLIEAKREEIYQSSLEGIALWESGKLKPTSDIDEHMRRLEEE